MQRNITCDACFRFHVAIILEQLQPNKAEVCLRTMRGRMLSNLDIISTVVKNL